MMCLYIMTETKPAPVTLMAVNPLNETTVHEVKFLPTYEYAVNGGNAEKVTSPVTNGHP